MSSQLSLRSPASTSLVVPGLSDLADPPTRQIDGAAVDYFLIEIVNALRASSAVATARSKRIEQEMIDAGLIPPLATAPPPLPLKNEGQKESGTSLALQRGSIGKLTVAEEEEEAVRTRLEGIGIHVGANFTERLCRDKPLFSERLDAIKFICKDVWVACWDKQVDNLRTNHRGVYVLQDNSFKTISRLSSWEGRADAVRRAKLYVAIPGGIIRGALSRLGFHGTVTPEIISLPQCTFQVKLPKGT